MQNFGQNSGATGKTALGLDANVGAALCYAANLIPCCLPLGLVYSIIVLIQDKTNKLTRFHAFQSITLSVVGVIVGILLQVINGVAIASKSTMLSLLVLVIALLFGLPLFIAIIYTAIQAYQGKIFKLPVVGDMADKWSS